MTSRKKLVDCSHDMRNNKTATFKFEPTNSKDNLPFQCNGYSIADKGPVGFYKNLNTAFKGIIFKDQMNNVTYFDIDYGLIKTFNESVWGNDQFVFQPQMKCLKICACNDTVSNVTNCNTNSTSH